MAQAYGENLKQAMDTLKAHKLRSILTVFGVVLGVSVIMLVAALITGFDQQVQENVKQYGADTAFISRFDQGPHGGPIAGWSDIRMETNPLIAFSIHPTLRLF